MYPTLALWNQTVAIPLPAKVRFPVLASAALYKVTPDPWVIVKSLPESLIIVTASPAEKTELSMVNPLE